MRDTAESGFAGAGHNKVWPCFGRKTAESGFVVGEAHQSHASWGAGQGRVRLRGGRDTAESGFEVCGT